MPAYQNKKIFWYILICKNIKIRCSNQAAICKSKQSYVQYQEEHPGVIDTSCKPWWSGGVVWCIVIESSACHGEGVYRQHVPFWHLHHIVNLNIHNFTGFFGSVGVHSIVFLEVHFIVPYQGFRNPPLSSHGPHEWKQFCSVSCSQVVP